eukprot:6482327-Amphidinium_carterae.1
MTADFVAILRSAVQNKGKSSKLGPNVDLIPEVLRESELRGKCKWDPIPLDMCNTKSGCNQRPTGRSWRLAR